MISRILCLLLLMSAVATGQDDRSPLVGLWRTESVSVDGKFSPPGKGELLFGQDGSLTITASSPEVSNGKPQRLTGSFAHPQKGVLTYSLNGSVVERWKFALKRDRITLVHLDYKVVMELVRVKASMFQDAVDRAAIPHLPGVPDLPARSPEIEQ